MTLKFKKPGKKIKVSKTPQKQNKTITLTQSQRKKVYQKYEGVCSYCGCEIEIFNFQVEHVIPRRSFKNKKDADFWDNLMPSCRACNIRKNTMSIERFRAELTRDIEQLKRDSPKFRLLLKYGLIELHQEPVEFYFEKWKKGKAQNDHK